MSNTTRSTTLLPPGLQVIELGESFATALAGRLLQRLGATVTRVMPYQEDAPLDSLGPHLGDRSNSPSATALWLREGKFERRFDGNSSESRRDIYALLCTADVVLISGTTQSWSERGLELRDVWKVAESAVIGHVTPWGDSGALIDRRSGELMLQASSGFMNLVGSADGGPVRLGGHPLQATAGLLALDGVLIGLFNRQVSGERSSFSTSEFEASAHLEWKIAAVAQTGQPIERRGDEGGGPMVAKTRDGYFGLFFTPRDWDSVQKLLGDERLADARFATPRSRAEHFEDLKRIVQEITQGLSKKDLYVRAQALNIPAGYVATMTDLLSSPQYRHRAFFQTVDLPGVGTGEIPDAPWRVLTAQDVEEGEAA